MLRLVPQLPLRLLHLPRLLQQRILVIPLLRVLEKQNRNTTMRTRIRIRTTSGRTGTITTRVEVGTTTEGTGVVTIGVVEVIEDAAEVEVNEHSRKASQTIIHVASIFS